MRRLSLLLTLAAWLVAAGSHWDLIQTVAWGRMVASYAKSMPLGEAVRLTFTPEGACRVCNVVADAREDAPGHGAPGGKADGKVLLVFEPAPVVVISAPGESRWRARDPLEPPGGRAVPPLPPPRMA